MSSNSLQVYFFFYITSHLLSGRYLGLYMGKSQVCLTRPVLVHFFPEGSMVWKITYFMPAIVSLSMAM